MLAHLLLSFRVFGLALFCICVPFSPVWCLDTESRKVESNVDKSAVDRSNNGLPQRESAVFAGGCFWCVESDFERAPGVVDVISGYSGGRTKNPLYENYASGGHREVVFVVYDPTQVTYAGLVEYLIKHIDPINRAGQFQDKGRQYSPAIYYQNEEEKQAAERVVAAINEMKIFRRDLNVALEKREAFWPAEDYHQDYHHKNGLKYQFFRLASGRDAFVQRHWGIRADKLEIDGAYPAADSSRSDGAPKSGDARANSTNELVADKPAATDIAVDKRATSAVKTSAIAAEDSAPDKPWAKFRKPEEEQLRQRLTKLQYAVTQHDETEPAYRNAYWDNHKAGIYVDIVSGEPLFSSAAKFESGTGWPSFVAPIEADAVRYKQDQKLFYTRVEVRSRYGDSHLGHLFDDGPVERGGKRYCMNSAALRFVPKEDMASQGYADYLPLVGE